MSTKALPKVRKVRIQVDASKSIEWLEQHQQEYIGKWVVLDGNRLLGAGNDPRPIVAQAREHGVKFPFVEFVREPSEPFMGGWL